MVSTFLWICFFWEGGEKRSQGCVCVCVCVFLFSEIFRRDVFFFSECSQLPEIRQDVFLGWNIFYAYPTQTANS